MQIKKYLPMIFKVLVALFLFLLGSFGGIAFSAYLCYQNFPDKVDYKEIENIRKMELQEGNFEIENWVAYDRDRENLFLCDGSLYDFGIKYLMFRISKGVLFSKTFKIPSRKLQNEIPKDFVYEKIGNQLWMKENLSIPVIRENDSIAWNAVTGLNVISKSLCIDDKESNCRKYGRFYDYETALTICPKGWRLPNNDDWKKIKHKIDPEKFADYYTGFYSKNNIGVYTHRHFEHSASWWSATPSSDTENAVFIFEAGYMLGQWLSAETGYDEALYPVRCVMDVK